MTRYDYIICGAGCAGLSLAYYLSVSGEDKRILLIDKDAKNTNDRTWSFWEKEQSPYESIIHKSWSKINFYSSVHEEQIDISPYRYKKIRSADFYAFMKDHLKAYANVDFLQAEINDFKEDNDGVVVSTSDGDYSCDRVFKSYLDEGFDFGSSQNVLQHFKGWEIQTEKDVFQPDVATFMDFRVEQNGEIRFLYVLPTSTKKALVEVAIFSNTILDHTTYDGILKGYIETQLDTQTYTIVEEEFGIIPMTTYAFEQHNTARIKHIGTAGGWVKASSGYAFKRIQHKSKALAAALVNNGDIDRAISSKNRFRRYDQIFLNALLTAKATGDEVFGKMFKRLDTDIIFKFLDEETSFLEDLKVFTGPPTMPFFRAFIEEL